MIKKKIVLDDAFKKDIIEAIEKETYDILEVNQTRECPFIETEVRGIARTKNHGLAEFTFKTARYPK